MRTTLLIAITGFWYISRVEQSLFKEKKLATGDILILT